LRLAVQVSVHETLVILLIGAFSFILALGEGLSAIKLPPPEVAVSSPDI